MKATDSLTTYIVIAVFFCALMGIGAVMKRMSRNNADYFRTGSRSSWWLVGMSLYMSSFSAWLFTGLAGMVFQTGWTIVIFIGCMVSGYIASALFFARWFRQMRATTFPEVLRKRYDPFTQQFCASIQIFASLFGSALQLYAMAAFFSSVTDFEIHLLIVSLGLITIFYSVSGGSWAVLATDFLQGLIMLPTGILLTYLAMDAMGGIQGMFSLIEGSGLTEAFKPIKSPDFDNGNYTLIWFAGYFINSIVNSASFAAAPRFFSAKDGKEASKAAVMGIVLVPITVICVAIPAIAARLLFEDTVMASGLTKPNEAAFAVIALELLPNGMFGLIAIAMFSATMSSLDTGLNRNAAIVILDILPAIRRQLKLPVASSDNLLASRISTFAFGLILVSIALYFSSRPDLGLFDIFFKLSALLIFPITMPFLGLFIRKVPPWSAWFTISVTLIPSVLGFFSESLFGEEWTYSRQILTNFAVAIPTFLLTKLFWKNTTQEYRTRVDDFFQKLHTPVDFEKEVGQANDSKQCFVLGSFSLAVGLLMGLLLLVPNEVAGRLQILSVVSAIVGIGVLLLFVGRKKRAKEISSQSTLG